MVQEKQRKFDPQLSLGEAETSLEKVAVEFSGTIEPTMHWEGRHCVKSEL